MQYIIKESNLKRFVLDEISKRISESGIPPYIRRRIDWNEDKIVNSLKRDVLRNLGKNKTPKQIIGIACTDTSYEIIDSTGIPYEESISYPTAIISNYLKEKFGDYLEEYINDTIEPSGNELGSKYVFLKHSERYGGNGFVEGYETWNQLLKTYAYWFPDLDWRELKNKLDSMNSGGTILIKKPGDINNKMNYYFSLKRLDV